MESSFPQERSIESRGHALVVACERRDLDNHDGYVVVGAL